MDCSRRNPSCTGRWQKVASLPHFDVYAALNGVQQLVVWMAVNRDLTDSGGRLDSLLWDADFVKLPQGLFLSRRRLIGF